MDVFMSDLPYTVGVPLNVDSVLLCGAYDSMRRLELQTEDALDLVVVGSLLDGLLQGKEIPYHGYVSEAVTAHVLEVIGQMSG